MGLRIGEIPETGNEFLVTPVVAEKIFDAEDLKKIADILETSPKRPCVIDGPAENYPDAKFTISFIPYIDENAWLYGKIYDLALEGNEQTYKYENLEMFEHIVYMEFNEDDYLNMHVDIGNEFPHNSRKLTAVLNLSDSENYRGGNFNIQASQLVTASRVKGDCSFFPSYLQNEIAPVHNGTKKILVAWFGGESYK